MTPKTVLIADDDHDLTDAIAIRCRQLGVQVLVAYDARTAFTSICQSHPDVICLDVKMPSGSGLSVCEMLNNDEELSSIPIIMLTGKSDEQTIRRCHEMCAYYVLKSTNVWERLAPILCELLDIDSGVSVKPNATASSSDWDEPTAPPSYSLDNLISAIKSDSVKDAETVQSPVNATDRSNNPIPPEPIKTTDHKTMENSSKQATILYIEDDVEASNALRIRLESFGLEVLQAFDGREGYRQAVAKAPDLILCDYSLPEGDGDYVLRRLQDNPVTETIPVVFVTGRTGDDLRRRLVSQGGAGFLTKPIAQDELLHELSNLLDIKLVEAEPVGSQ